MRGKGGGRERERSMISIAGKSWIADRGYVAHETSIEESRRKLHAPQRGCAYRMHYLSALRPTCL